MTFLRDELSELLGFKILPNDIEKRLTSLDQTGVLIGKQTKINILLIKHLIEMEEHGGSRTSKQEANLG